MLPLLNFSAFTYEAIIFTFIALALIQSVALIGKGYQTEALKLKNADIARASGSTIIRITSAAGAAVFKAVVRARQAEARADAAEEELRVLLQADADKLHTPTLDDLILFGRGIARGREVEADLTRDDVLAALRGDTSEIERKVGSRVVSVGMFNKDGREIVGAEKDALLDMMLFQSGRENIERDENTKSAARPSFDIIEPLVVDPAAFGTDVHESIERARPDESCGTQQPHAYASSSPRAG